MKPVFKCDYCDFMGTEEEVREHEAECYEHYDLRSCTTCVHKQICFSKEFVSGYFKCKCGVDLSEGKMMLRCGKYERKEDTDDLGNIFSGLFGGL